MHILKQKLKFIQNLENFNELKIIKIILKTKNNQLHKNNYAKCNNDTNVSVLN